MKIDTTWHVADGHGACLIKHGGNPDVIADRVAFIEKTPRVRVRPEWLGQECRDHLNWAEGPSSGDDASDPESRAWCEQALRMFGHEFVDGDGATLSMPGDVSAPHDSHGHAEPNTPLIKLMDERDNLMRALEVIAVGDSKDPVHDAASALVELGLWTAAPSQDERSALKAAVQDQEAEPVKPLDAVEQGANPTPRVDALLAAWEDDGASRGPAFVELRDLARDLEREAAPVQAPTFHTGDDDLDELLTDTYFRPNSMDTGLKWLDALERVMAKMPPTPATQATQPHDLAGRVDGLLSSAQENAPFVPTEPGVYAWSGGEGTHALVLVNKRPSPGSPGGTLNGHVMQSSKFHDGLAVDQWGQGIWLLLDDFKATAA